MGSFAVRQDDITFEEFLDLIPDGEKADLLDGVIYMASPDNTDAADLNSWLGAIILSFVDLKELGKVYFSRVAYRIGPKRGPEPDIGFVPKALEKTRRRGYIDGPPALAIEIVSPDSVNRDYIHKRKIYEEAGVREYWIIDPIEKSGFFLGLVRGVFRELPVTDNVFCSRVVPGFSLDLRWLWRPQPPRVAKAMAEIKKRARGNR
jgi:Uma2 family endonuclease